MILKILEKLDSFLFFPINSFFETHSTAKIILNKLAVIIFLSVVIRFLYGILRRFFRFMPNL